MAEQKRYLCASCPMRRLGMARPRSIFARIHRWHAARCPSWKAYQAELRAQEAVATGHA